MKWWDIERVVSRDFFDRIVEVCSDVFPEGFADTSKMFVFERVP